jgi:hypothetical protein
MGRLTRTAAAGLALVLALVVAAVAAPLDRDVELASTGPRDGGPDSADVGSGALSDDGSVVAFDTDEPLTAEDTDAHEDVYVRSGGTTTLVSGGPLAGGLDSADASFEEVSGDGKRVYLVSTEPLVGADGDLHRDVYVWEAGTLKLVSGGPLAGGLDSADAFFDWQLPTGVVFLSTAESLAAGDSDSTVDIYRATPNAGGSFDIAHVSDGTDDGGGDSAIASFAGVSDDGQHVFFATDEPLELAVDNDSDSDLYRRSGGTTTMLSGGPLNGGVDSAGISYFTTGDISDDGLAKGFATSEPLDPADADAVRDVYRGGGGAPRLVSKDTVLQVDAVSPTAGGFDFFQTADALLPADTDAHLDVYAADETSLRLISDGPLAGGVDSAAVAFGARPSADAGRVLFRTSEPLVPEDSDTHADVYERQGAVTRLISGGPLAGGPDSADAVVLTGARDGSRWLFATSEPLTADDTDTHLDYYEHSDGELALVTTGPRAGGADSASATLRYLTHDATRLLFSTDEPLVEADGDLHEDLYRASPPPPPAPPVAAADTTRPVVGRLRIRPARFRKGRLLPRAARKVRTGTTIRLRLSEAARLRLTFARVRPGRRVRGRCRKQTRRNRGRPRCRRYTRVRGAISPPGRQGANRIRFQGRLNRRRGLRPGRYRLVVRATDSAGNRSRPSRAGFTLLRAKVRRTGPRR